MESICSKQPPTHCKMGEKPQIRAPGTFMQISLFPSRYQPHAVGQQETCGSAPRRALPPLHNTSASP